MKKIIQYGIIIVLLLQCVACGPKQPTETQIKNDIERNLADWTIFYDSGENKCEDINPVSDSHILKLKALEVEKSKTEEDSYEGWFKVKLEDNDINATAFAHVIYTLYDNNIWEMTFYNEYQQKTSEYIGDFNIKAVHMMFSGQYTVEKAEIVEYETGNKAVVKLIVTNTNGYQIVAKHDEANRYYQQKYASPVQYETTVTFNYNKDLQTWEASGISENAKSLSSLNNILFDKAVKNSCEWITEFRHRGHTGDSSFSEYDFSYEIEEYKDFSEFANEAVKTDSLTVVLNCSNTTVYCTENFKTYATITLSKSDTAPPFTHCIDLYSEINSTKEIWHVDDFNEITYSVGSSGEQTCRFHVIYPYQNDETKALVETHNLTFDPNGEHIIKATYSVDCKRNVVYIDDLYALIYFTKSNEWRGNQMYVPLKIFYSKISHRF